LVAGLTAALESAERIIAGVQIIAEELNKPRPYPAHRPFNMNVGRHHISNEPVTTTATFRPHTDYLQTWGRG
jgi:hypothetical protein